MGIAEDIILIIVAGLVFGFIAHKLKLPLILGYIFAGIIIGPYAGGVSVKDTYQIELLAEIGVALLLFSIGLDLSIREIKDVRKIALIGTPVQLILTIVYGYAIGYFLNLDWKSSVILGAVVSLSSTMVVIKTLMSRGLMGTLSSKVMTGILIIQDLAAVPMMIMIPQLNNLSQSLYGLGIILLKGVLVLGLVVILGAKLIPYMLKHITKLDSHELFLVTITALGLGIGYVTYKIGLSFALGAFTAGVVLSESDYNHKALSDIIPLRDIFGLLFFTSIGLLIDITFLQKNIIFILFLACLIVFGKFIIFSLLSRVFGYFNVVPLAVGLGLSQVGEFSFVLAQSGLTAKLLTTELYSAILSASVVTMIASPFLSMLTAPLYLLKNRYFKKEIVQTINFPEKGLANHVIISGGGRVGQNIAAILHDLGFNFVIIEQDFARFEEAKASGYPVIYGDAGQDTVMIAAEIAKANLLLITVPSLIIARRIIGRASIANPELNIIARSRTLEEADELHKLNIYEVVQPEFEASLEITRQALLHLGFPAIAIQKYMDDARRQKYSAEHYDKHILLTSLKDASQLLEMEWFDIPASSPFVGKSIKDLEIRSATGVTVVAIFRNNELVPNPGFDFVFGAGDIAAVIGKSEHRKYFGKMIAMN